MLGDLIGAYVSRDKIQPLHCLLKKVWTDAMAHGRVSVVFEHRIFPAVTCMQYLCRHLTPIRDFQFKQAHSPLYKTATAGWFKKKKRRFLTFHTSPCPVACERTCVLFSGLRQCLRGDPGHGRGPVAGPGPQPLHLSRDPPPLPLGTAQ